jgi:phosphoglycolate phosphatase-like HAD superfamily hydrolase
MSSNGNGFRWRDFDAYLFDIDGTLLTNRDLIHYRALNYTMRHVYGADTTIDGIPYHGKTDLGILRAALERVGVSAECFELRRVLALQMVRDHVERNAEAMRPRVCEAIPQALDHLRSADKLMAVASGNLEAVGWRKVHAAGLRDYFRYGCFCDEHELREEIFQNAQQEARRRLGGLAQVCFIGDTPSDILAARHVGAKVIAVGTGIYKCEELAAYRPDACVHSCAELLEHL